MSRIPRKTATLINVGFQYLMMALMIVRGLFIPPLAATHIDHDLLGAWFASGNVMNWLMITEGGAWLYLRQRIAVEHGRSNAEGLSGAIGAGAMVLFALGLLIALAGILLSRSIPVWMHVTGAAAVELQLAFALTAVGLGMSLPATIPRAVTQGLQRQVYVNLTPVVSELIALVCSIVLIVKGYGVVALGIGPLVREIIHNALNWPFFLHLLHRLRVRPTFELAELRGMSGQMGWTFLTNLTRTLKRSMDAFIVSQLFGNSAVLVVEWTKRAWELLALLVTRASSAVTPALAHVHGEGDAIKLRTVGLRLFGICGIATGTMFALLVALNGPFIAVWVGGKFFAGTAFNVIFGLAVVSSTVAFTISEVLFAIGCIRGPAIAQFASSVLRLVLLLGLTPVLGVLSLPLSLLLTDALAEIPYLSMQLRCSLQYTHHEILQLFGAMSRALVVAAVAGGLWMLVPAASGWGGLMAHGVAVCLILGCAYWFIEPQMRQASAATLRFLRARVPGGAR